MIAALYLTAEIVASLLMLGVLVGFAVGAFVAERSGRTTNSDWATLQQKNRAESNLACVARLIEEMEPGIDRNALVRDIDIEMPHYDDWARLLVTNGIEFKQKPLEVRR